MNNAKNIDIITQAFYGNRVGTTINKDRIDAFILGYVDDNIKVTKPIDRTIIHIPNDENIVIVYNKYAEEERIKFKEKALKEDNYVIKPLATIAENNIELYSRCIACRIDSNGEFASIEKGDYAKIIKYLAE